MSKLPRIASTRSSNKNTEIESTNEISNTPNKSKEGQNIILPNINQDNDIIRNPLVINSKLTQLETKLLYLEQNYELVLNKISQNEVKLSHLDNKQKNMSQDINTNFFNNNPNISIKQNIPPPTSVESREISVLNNKIKFIEQMLKSEQEQRALEKQKELDFNKSLFNKINTSLMNTIQMEMEQRFKGDLMQKNANNKEIDALQRQISNLATQIEEIHRNLTKKIEDNNNECSERNQGLVRYVETKLDEDKITKDLKGIQLFIEKLMEQIKNNMNTQNNANEYSEKKIKYLEDNLTNSIKDIYDFLNKIEVRIANKIKYLKKYFEINTINNNNQIEANIRSIVKNLEKNMSFLAEELASYQKRTILEFQNVHKTMKFQNQAAVTDLENLLKHQNQLENIVFNRYKEMEQMNKNFYNRMATFESKVDVSLTNEKILRNFDNNNLKKEIQTVSGNVSNTNQVLFTDLNKLIHEHTTKNDSINEKFKKIEDDINKHKNSISKIEIDLNETLTKTIVNEMTQLAVEEKISSELNRVKLFERSISNNREDIIKLNDRIVDAFNSLGGISKQGDKINDMIIEKEMRDDVDKIMNKMLEECSILEAKEEARTNINNLSNRMYENIEKQEENVKKVENEMKDLNSKNEQKIKELEENINNSITGSNISKSVTQMITNAEIDNIYQVINNLNKTKTESKIDDEAIEKILKQIKENNDVTTKTLANYSDIIDNKVNKTLEKVRQDNLDMWANSVSLGQKMNSPEEIQKLIKEIPPVVMPLDETLQKIMNLTFKHENPKPFIPDLYENEKQIDEENFGKILIEKEDDKDKKQEEQNTKENVKEPEKEKEKKSEKESEKVSSKSKNTKTSKKSKKNEN